MNRLRSPFRIAIYVSMIALLMSGCRHGVDCMAPPSEIAIQIIDGPLTYPADLDTAARIRVSYIENNQQKYIPDLVRIKDVFLSSILIETSRSANDPEFSFELKGKVLAKIKLETYVNKTKCNRWAAISKVYQNGEVISRSSTGAYLLNK